MKLDYLFWSGGYAVPMRPQAIVDAAQTLGMTARLIGDQAGDGRGFGIKPVAYGDMISAKSEALLCIGGGQPDMITQVSPERPVILDYSDCWALQVRDVAEAFARFKESAIYVWSITDATTRELEALGYPSERIRQVPNAFSERLMSIPEASLLGPKHKHITVFGTFGDWTDPEIILDLAKRMPDYQIFIFTNFDPPARLLSEPNIHVYRQVHPFAFLPLLSSACCSITPFAYTDFALGSDPIKYYESVAMNTRVLVSNVVALQGKIGAGVILSRDRKEIVNYFEEQIRSEDGRVFDSAEALHQWRLDNHWNARLRAPIQEVIDTWQAR